MHILKRTGHPWIFNIEEADFQLVALVVLKKLVLPARADYHCVPLVRQIERDLEMLRIERCYGQDMYRVFLDGLHNINSPGNLKPSDIVML